jgi:hypothetical protein
MKKPMNLQGSQPQKAITPHAFLKINGKSAGHDSAAQIDDPGDHDRGTRLFHHQYQV